MSDSSVDIPTLSSGTPVRTVQQTIDESGTSTTVQTQVVALGDPSGRLADFSGGALPVESPELTLLTRAMLLRLDFLCYRIDSRYSPPDKLGL